MKVLFKFTILFLLIQFFVGCNKPINKKSVEYNGIDGQILHIVDSIDICPDYPFITIWFSSCNDSNYVVRFFNNILIPVMPLPSDTIKKTSISESDDFLGYKKYHNIYLVFLEHRMNKQSDKFVKRDSLKLDEDPFAHFRVYDLYKKTKEYKTIEKKYLINENDSLILFDGKCSFDID